MQWTEGSIIQVNIIHKSSHLSDDFAGVRVPRGRAAAKPLVTGVRVNVERTRRDNWAKLDELRKHE
jgi:hypothetical protein